METTTTSTTTTPTTLTPKESWDRVYGVVVLIFLGFVIVVTVAFLLGICYIAQSYVEWSISRQQNNYCNGEAGVNAGNRNNAQGNDNGEGDRIELASIRVARDKAQRG